ncbi:serine---pyruvate transaminase [Gammaproteobacteria bacterium]
MLNFSVGPVLMDEEILEVGSQQIPYFRTHEFSKIMLENEALLKETTGALSSTSALFLTCSGTGAMEAVVINCLTQQDKVLVINGGSFGARFEELCIIHQIPHEVVNLAYGEPLTQERIKEYEGKCFTALLINKHETSTGVLYDMDVVKNFCRAENTLLVVDAISTFLADELSMERDGIDVLIISSQKALALPPGISIVLLNEKIKQKISDRHPRMLYFDFNHYLKDGVRGQTPFTPAVSILLQLNKKLRMISRVGIASIIAQVKEQAEDFRSKLGNLPLKFFHNHLSNALTPLQPLGGWSATELFNVLKNEYNIFVCPNGGTLKETLFRIGHIGAITKKDNNTLIHALWEIQKGMKQ